MTATLLILLFGRTLTGCGPAETDPQYFVFPNDEVQLGRTAYTDAQTKWVNVGIVNETYFPLEIRNIRVEGDGFDFIELFAPGLQGGTFDLGIRQSTSIRLRVKPPTQTGTSRWTTQAYDDLTLRFSVRGTGKIDPATGLPDQSAIVTIDEELPIRMQLLCDLDGDGFDDESCSGGLDCDDRLELVSPDAVEYCDGIDNDCDGTVDNEGCRDSE